MTARSAAAQPRHVDGICGVCAAGWRDTYAAIGPVEYVESVIREFYVPQRVRRELAASES